MKTHSWLMGAAMGAAIMSGCTEQNGYDLAEEKENDRQNEYFTAWLKTFGQIPEDQDWCMLDVAEARITTAALGDSISTEIYSAPPAVGGHVKGYAMGDASLLIDITEGTQQLYTVMRSAQGEVVAEGYCTIADGVMAVNPSSLTPAGESRYAHDTSYFDAMIVCEDMGSIGDFDFNDVVLGIRRIAGTGYDNAQLKITPLAAGGKYAANVIFNYNDLGEIHDLVRKGASPGNYINCYKFDKPGQVIVIDVSPYWTIKDNWKQIKLRIKGISEAYDVSAPAPGDAPRMMCLGGDFFWPAEKLSIKDVYKNFTDWATGNYTASEDTWIDDKKDAQVVPWQINDVLSWFRATTTSGNPFRFREVQNIASGDICHYDVPTNCSSFFSSVGDFNNIDADGSHFDTSSVTNMNTMFQGLTKMTNLNASDWNTSRVTSMSGMFAYCYALTNLDLRNWDTSLVTNMAGMFSECKSLPSLDVGNFNTCNVQAMRRMFYNCSSLTSLDLSNFDTSNVQSTDAMFYGCTNLKTLDISNWDTSRITEPGKDMFTGCTSLETLKMSNWRANNSEGYIPLPGNLEYPKLKSVDMSNWKVERKLNLMTLFTQCPSLEKVDMSNWDVLAPVYSIAFNFTTYELQDLDLSGWKISNVTNLEFNASPPFMVKHLNLSGWSSESLKSVTFCGAKNVKSIDFSNWNVPNLENLFNMFSGCSSLTSLDLSSLETSKVTNMCSMFYCCSSLTSLDLSKFNTSNVADMSGMFYSCSSLTSLDLSKFNTPNVTNMGGMFCNCSSLTNLDLSKFDASKVTSMSGMFSGCPEGLNITCKATFRDWCIANEATIGLPEPLKDASSTQWHIVTE